MARVKKKKKKNSVHTQPNPPRSSREKYQTENSCISLTTIATEALFAASATRFISFLRELAGSSGFPEPEASPTPVQAGVFLGMDPLLLVEVGVGFGTRRVDSLFVLDEDDEDIMPA
jgi:hypothetical protein